MRAGMDGFDFELVWRRSGYLEALHDTSRSKCELEDYLDHSRSTVNRAVADLVDAGLVEEDRGECRVTLAGRLAYEACAKFRARARGIASAQDLFPALGPETELGLEVTTGADVQPARGVKPYQAFHEFERLIEEASCVRGSVWTFANPRGEELFDEAIVERGVPVEFYIAESFYEQIRHDFTEAFDRWREQGDFSGFVVPDCPRYTILVSDLPTGREAGVAVYAADREFYGVLINDTTDAVKWAERQLDALAERATPLTEVAECGGASDPPGDHTSRQRG